MTLDEFSKLTRHANLHCIVPVFVYRAAEARTENFHDFKIDKFRCPYMAR